MFRRLSFLLFLLPGPAYAAINGPAISDNDYKVDIGQNVVLGSPRRVGMGGAYTGVAEGAATLHDNPAAAAYRRGNKERSWDWDATLGSFSPAGDDIDNNGSKDFSYDRQTVFTAGALFQKGKWGVGFYNVAQSYQADDAARENKVQLQNIALAFGRSHFDRRFTWGAGFRIVDLDLRTGARKERALKLSGAGFLLGAVYQPGRGPLRFGAAYAGPVHEDQKRALNATSTAPVAVNGLYVPEQVTVPVVGSVGVSYDWASAPFWPGRRFLASADVRVIGRVKESYGVESFLEQKVQKTGQRLDAGLHLGGELEALPERLRVRLGTYWEPSRFVGVDPRQHLTAGFELRLFKFRFFGERHAGLSYAGDFASRYVNNFVSLGLWDF